MKKKTNILLGLAVIGGLLFYAFKAAGPEARPSAKAPEVSAHSSKVLEQPHSAEAPRASSRTPALAAPLTLESAERQTILETIHLASISYDAVELPRIQPFLSHLDPEVRAAALNGIVVLGHSAGAPLLREAAKRAGTPPFLQHLSISEWRDVARWIAGAEGADDHLGDMGSPPSSASASSP
jgi:hypothetical protein